MKKFTIMMIFCLSITHIFAQTDVPKVNAIGVVKTNVNLRGAPVVLEQIDFTAPGSGTVIVHFDGTCIPTSGDRIVLAASNTTGWTANDGNVSVKDTRKPFSHTRAYSVTAGNHTFYAIGQNYVDQGGTGIASVYGTLSIEYIPDAHSVIAKHTGISKTNVNLRGAAVNLGEITFNAPSAGKVWVHFDGACIPSVGDRIVLAASNSVGWTANEGNTSVAHEGLSFSHSMTYDVTAGSQTFYAVGQNYVETSGTGFASVYGSLTVIFFPSSSDYEIESEGYSESNVNLRGNPVVLEQAEITASTAGKVLVQFNGFCIPSSGDRIVLAASNTTNWGINDGCITVTSNKSSFSHSRIYDVAAGTHTFYGVGQNYVEMNGTGIASVYGHLVVKFFPDGTADLDEYLASAIKIYPNPAQDFILIETQLNSIIELTDINGKIIETIRTEQSVSELNISQLTTGIYLLNIKDSDGSQLQTRKFVKSNK